MTPVRRQVTMNVAYFLTPKSRVVWVRAAGTLAEAIERMRPNGYTAVPILDDDGGYVGTLTEGDVLWHLLEARDSWTRLARTPAGVVPRGTDNQAVHIDAELETLVARAVHQNFVPVVDDREVFIGIVRRKPIILHYARLVGSRPHPAPEGAA
jgi:CBS domain-containing protein